MARSTGAATSGGNFLSALSTACQAQSCTEEQRYTEGDNSYDLLVLSDTAGFYFYIAWDGTDTFYIKFSPSYTASIGWDSIPGAHSYGVKCAGPTFPASGHYIHVTETECHVAIEFEVTRYRHFSFGTIEKADAGSWTGGEYAVGMVIDDTKTYTSSFQQMMWVGHQREGDFNGLVRAVSVDSGGNTFHRFGEDNPDTGYALGSGPDAGFYLPLFNASPNVYNQRCRLLPILVWISNNGTSSPSYYIPLGYVRNVRHVNMKNFTEKEELDDNPGWWVYPVLQKSESFGTSPTDSKYHGLAYKE